MYKLLIIITLLTVFGKLNAKSITVPLSVTLFDASGIIHPGDTVYLEAGTRPYMRILNVSGDSLHYVTVTNKQGEVIIENDDFHYGMVMTNCKYFRLTGSMYNDSIYGIRILKTGKGASGLSMSELSTNYEVDHIEVANTGFAGIFAFSQPTCDLASNRGNFVQRNTVIHDNYIHDTFGEGMYIGHSFYNGYSMKCGDSQVVVYPHEIEGLKVYRNLLVNNGYDAMQICCATSGTEIYNNTIINYGTQNVEMQHSGIQIGIGTKLRCYNNFIYNGSGTGIMMLGFADSYIYNNVIVNAGLNFYPADKELRIHGIFVDDRLIHPGTSHYIVNNTILNTKSDGIRFYSTQTSNNIISNNLIVNPGSVYPYDHINTKYLNIKQGASVTQDSNMFLNFGSFFNTVPAQVSGIKHILRDLPLRNSGVNVSAYGVTDDFSGALRHVKPSIGAFEYSDSDTTKAEERNKIVFKYNTNEGLMTIHNLSSDQIRSVAIYDFSGVRVCYLDVNESDFVMLNTTKLFTRGKYILAVQRTGLVFTYKFFEY